MADTDEISGPLTDEPSPEAPLVEPAEPAEPGPPVESGWMRALSAAGAAGIVVGRATARAARAVGRGASSAYHAIDPDVRQHIAEAPILGLTLLAGREKEDEPLEDDGHRPILFVHGLGGHPGNFFPMRTYLRVHGRKRAVSFSLPEGSIEEIAGALRAAIISLAERTGQATIDVVAHSMGGVVARVAIEDEAVRARVATIVTLGTPHTGTYLARLAATSRTIDLRPGSTVVEKLGRQLPWKAPPRLVTLWSEKDMVVFPPESARVEGAEQFACHDTTHTGYLLEIGVFRRVLDVLEDRVL